MTTHLDKIAEILCEAEWSDDTAIKLHDLMSAFAVERGPTYRHLKSIPGFAKLWEALAESVDRAGGFEGGTP